jgi:putative pyruvate formate lyase activating enzyme
MSYVNCQLCPRRCGVNRTAGQTGFCGAPGIALVAKTMLHPWEEPALSPRGKSGAVFFGGCTLRCSYCQNIAISARPVGQAYDSAGLRRLFDQLIHQGAENIDLVTPTQYLPTILPALEPKLPVPVVYNCGGYERAETLQALEGKVDIYLPDLKYLSPERAERYSGAADYPEVAAAAILEMYRQVGPVQIDDEIMKKGMILRHLILPGQIDNSLGVLDWIDDHFKPGQILLSLMSQYVPMGKAKTMPGFDRPINETEYDAVVSYMELLGIEDGYTQDFSAAVGEYIPEWDLSGL